MKTIAMRLLTLVLALAMLVSLAACGKTAEAEATAQPEYVYRSEFAPVTGGAGGDLRVLTFTADGAYAVCQEKVGREIPEGADLENLTEEDLARFDIYESCLYHINNKNVAEKLSAYKPLPGLENTKGYRDYYSQSSLDGIVVNDAGELLAVETMYTGWYDGPEGKKSTDEDYYDYYKSSQQAFIRTLSANGAEIKCAELETGESEYVNPRSVTDADGNILCSVDTSLRAYNADGKEVYSVESNGYVQNVLKLADGSVYIALWGDNGMELAPLDAATHTLGKSVPLPNDAYDPISGGGDYDIYYTSGLSFFGYDLETGTTEALFNWVNCDVNSGELNFMRVTDSGAVEAFLTSYDYAANTSDNEHVVVAKQPYDPAMQRETLTLACISLDENIRDAVIKFNRGSDGARIEIKDYSQFNTADDYTLGEKKLLTEAMAGDIADIVALDSLPFRRIASKGLLEDLYPYLDNDGELERADFFPNVLDAMTVDGKLYGVTPSFYVVAIMGATKVVGERDSWTYEEFAEALASMPEGCEPFEQGVSRDDIFKSCLVLDLPDYVNWSTGECSFNSEQFRALLEFANSFPAPLPDGAAADEESTQSRIQSGKQMLLATSIYSLDDALYDCSYFGGEDVRYIGFPTYSGNGNALRLQGGMAMSAKCVDKDAAWQFMRSFLNADHQKSNVWSIPSNISAFESKLAEMMKTRYAVDENGQFELDENGEKIKEPRYTMSADDGPVVNVYAMTQEQADAVTAAVKAVTRSFDYDQSIIDIAVEQSAAYFAGQKTADEVAKLVQSKANIYVNEQQ